MSKPTPSQAFVLRVAPGGTDRVPEALEKNCIIIGWAGAKGLIEKNDWWDFRNAVHQAHYAKDDNYRAAGNAAGSLWKFIRVMDAGDWVVVPHGDEFYVCEVTGPAFYDDTKRTEGSPHRRPVRWLNNKKPLKRFVASTALQSRMKIQGTCANATDLIPAIWSALEETETPDDKDTVFERQLHQRLKETTLATIREGKINDRGFEKLLKSLFEAEDAEVVIIPRNKDKGADLKVTFKLASSIAKPIVVGVQAKHYQASPPVPAHIADDLAKGLQDIGADFGMIITCGTVSPELVKHVRELNEKDDVRIDLVDGEQLASWLIEKGLAPGFSTAT